MVLAVGFQPDIAQDDISSLALDLLEGTFEELHRVSDTRRNISSKGGPHGAGVCSSRPSRFGVVTGPTKPGVRTRPPRHRCGRGAVIFRGYLLDMVCSLLCRAGGGAVKVPILRPGKTQLIWESVAAEI